MEGVVGGTGTGVEWVFHMACLRVDDSHSRLKNDTGTKNNVYTLAATTLYTRLFIATENISLMTKRGLIDGAGKGAGGIERGWG